MPFPSVPSVFPIEPDQARSVLLSLVDGDALQMVFQPVVDIRTGRNVGAEALARFHVEPPRTPDVWFNEAWMLGVGLELEVAAIVRALKLIEQLPPDAYLAVNASPVTLCSDALLAALQPFALTRVVF